ncbi:MAG: hypothetical protein WC634_01430 [archaeon]
MAESAEMRLMQRDTSGAMHDLMKYLNPFEWKLLFSRNKSIEDPDFLEAKKAYYEIVDGTDKAMDLVFDKKAKSVDFKATALKLNKDIQLFQGKISAFARSSRCPARLRAEIRGLFPSIKIMLPLSRILIEGKPRLVKRWIKVRPLVAELQAHLNRLRKLAKLTSEVFDKPLCFPEVSFRVRGNPVVLADKMHLQRVMFNVFHDAVTHSRGEAVVVTVGMTKNSLVFATTNRGRWVSQKVIRLMGKKPYSEDPLKEVAHGYGKISAKDAVEAHGGQFVPKNAPKGFTILSTIPRKLRRRAA